MSFPRLAPLPAAFLVLAALAPPAPGQDRPIALKGAAIETVSEAGRIESGVIVLKDGKIEAVGPVGEVEIPDDARVIDAGDRTIMPGIVEPALSYRGSTGGASGTAMIGGRVVTLGGSSSARTPPFSRSADVFDPYRTDFSDLLRSGLTHLNLTPPDYGQAAVVRITPDDPEAMIAEADGRLYLSLSNSTPTLDLLRRSLERADRGDSGDRGQRGRARDDSLRGPGRSGGSPQSPSDPSRDLWRAVVEGKAPLIADPDNASAILYLLDAIGDFEDIELGLIASGQDVYLTLDRLAERGKLTLLLRPAIDTMPQNRDLINIPRIVHERGIEFAFTQGGRPNAPSAQDAPLFDVGYLIATGLPREAALEALTSRPAELIGQGDALGRIEPGMSGSLLLFDGDPFDPYSRLRTVIIEGSTIYETD